MRVPSSSTTLRNDPRPRRSTYDDPPLPLLTAEPVEGTTPGRSRRIASARVRLAKRNFFLADDGDGARRDERGVADQRSR